MKEYEFTKPWFKVARSVWDQLIPNLNPHKILEVGCYEGAATCYLIEKLGSHHSLEIDCIDSWEGGIEHGTGAFAESKMSEVEQRFRNNITFASRKVGNKIDVKVHRGLSEAELPKLLVSGKTSYYDFIYIDGSHQSPDVLMDAVLSFKLLKVGGVIAFDDYIWSDPSTQGTDPIQCPKLAIDCFTNIYCRKLKVLSTHLYQLYIQKTSD